MSATASHLPDIDLTDLDNFADGFPHHLFQIHRLEAPVWWHAPTEHTPDGEGFWSVATHAEATQVLLDPETYSSERGGSRRHGGTLLQDLEIAGVVLSMMDDPRHARIRRLVSAGLTPRMVGRVEDDLRRRVRDLLAPIEDDVPVDIVTDVVAELAMQTIGNLVGVPEKDRRLLLLLLALRCRLGHHAQRHRRRPARARRAPRPARRPTRRPFPAAAGARGDPP